VKLKDETAKKEKTISEKLKELSNSKDFDEDVITP
jgi:hypothetical protein